jgi:hypothetical protein
MARAVVAAADESGGKEWLPRRALRTWISADI